MNFGSDSIISYFRKAVAFACVCVAGAIWLSGSAMAQLPPKNLTYSQGWTSCAKEGDWCEFYGGIKDVAYGANGRYIYLLGVQDNVMCSNGEFWESDPIKGVSKQCYYSTGPSRLARATICSGEFANCSVTGTATIWFGGNGQFVPKNITAADGVTTTVACTSTAFGSDPNQGQRKYCLVTP